MIKKIRAAAFAFLFAVSVGGTFFTAAMPQTAFASCSDRLLTFPAWYRGLLTADCDIISPADPKIKGGISQFIWTIVLNVIEMGLQLVGYIAVGMIIFGGFKYIYSAGTADGMARGRKTITNAVIGLALSMASVAIVNLIAGAIK